MLSNNVTAQYKVIYYIRSKVTSVTYITTATHMYVRTKLYYSLLKQVDILPSKNQLALHMFNYCKLTATINNI